MKFALVVAGALASKEVAKDDDVVMLSMAAMRESLQVEDSLTEVSRAKNPREASELLQQYALSTVQSETGLDEDTRKKLVAIRDILTNETYIALEQGHRHDQDMLNKHARAINDCGAKHIRHLQQDVEGQEVSLVRDLERSMYECYGLPGHSDLLQAPDAQRFWANWSRITKEEGFVSCGEAKKNMITNCDALHKYIEGLPKPNCNAPVGTTELEEPSCDASLQGLDSDLFDWFTNMKENALFYQGEWRALKKQCDDDRAYVKEVCKECNKEQSSYETSFCSYRQGLHATCREYQGCHVLNEEQFTDLVKSVMYNSDSRKIDWKAIHKIECYINVLISTETNEVRAKDLLNCEAGNLNTIETILTGFNETNYLSLIVPEINVSCWDIEVPRFIDFKECDMSSVTQHPCTEKWMDRYNGVYSAGSCTECAPIPDEFQYHMDQDAAAGDRATSDDYGGGWYFVNELGHSTTDIDDLTELAAGGYHLPLYMTGKLHWNEVLVERVSHNWCDSWGAQTSKWVEDGGASMCVQSDDSFVYCMNNAHGGHSWRRQPVSHFTALCGGKDQPDCDCWPKNKENICWAYNRSDASGPTLENIEAPKHVRILSMKNDGSVVKISFQGEEKTGTLRVGNYNAFVQDAEGCRAITAVKYRVYVRCLGCSVEETEFHAKDGAQFNGGMTIGKMTKREFSEFTYEAWFKSPLKGKDRREIFGGLASGLYLVNENAVKCLHHVGSDIADRQKSGYQLHVGGTEQYGAFCFEPDTFYHVAVTKDAKGLVKTFVNGRDVTAKGSKIGSGGKLTTTLGGGFGDGGQLFNVRIWDHARTQPELYQDAFVMKSASMSHVKGLEHWWPLTENVKDIITGIPLEGAEVRYAPLWCADLEKSGMRGC